MGIIVSALDIGLSSRAFNPDMRHHEHCLLGQGSLQLHVPLPLHLSVTIGH